VMHEDVGGPVPLLPDLVSAVGDVAREHDLMIPVVAHAGDGNTHPLIIFDGGDVEQVARAQAAFEQIMRRAVGLGGTITGEHGVGRMKRGVLPDQLGPDVMALSRRIKAAFDPDGILSPGVML
jgi:glycolate oxidase